MMRNYFLEYQEKKIAMRNLNLVDIVRSSNATADGYRELREFYFERTLDVEERESRKKNSVRFFDMLNKKQADASNEIMKSIFMQKKRLEGLL